MNMYTIIEWMYDYRREKVFSGLPMSEWGLLLWMFVKIFYNTIGQHHYIACAPAADFYKKQQSSRLEQQTFLMVIRQRMASVKEYNEIVDLVSTSCLTLCQYLIFKNCAVLFCCGWKSSRLLMVCLKCPRKIQSVKTCNQLYVQFNSEIKSSGYQIYSYCYWSWTSKQCLFCVVKLLFIVAVSYGSHFFMLKYNHYK